MCGEKLLKSLRDDFGITLAGGQDQWKRKVVRIAHLGYVETFDIIIAISPLEMALKKIGTQVELGKGVARRSENIIRSLLRRIADCIQPLLFGVRK